MKERDLQELTITKLAALIRSKKVSPVEVTKLCLERIHRLNPLLNAYFVVTEERALSDAKNAEREIAKRKYLGPLHGIPVSIKDNIATKGVLTVAGSKVLGEWVPDFDATVVKKLKEAGAIVLGKTNMHEWAMGGTTINPFYGTTLNPWDRTRIAGGSSGGSGAAVAASMCLASIGTDNGGSVRNPASLCGVVGLKPTFGRISHFGGVHGTGGFSTDHFGIFTKTVEDCAIVLQSAAGHDSSDPTSAAEPVSNYSKIIGKKVKGLKLGLIKDFDALMVSEVKKVFAEAVAVLESLGMKKVEVSIPHMPLVPPVWVATSRSENASAHVPHLRARPRDYSRGLLHQNISALMIPAETYVTAQRVRRIICQEFDDVLKRVDVIVAPTGPMPAPTIEECNQGFVDMDGKRISLRDSGVNFRSLFTVPFNVTGLPALSVCCGFSTTALPIGMQIVGEPFQESVVFQIAHAYESEAEWYTKKPPLP